MGQIYDNAMVIAQRIREKCDRKVDLCVVLGSGLGAFVDALDNQIIIPYSQIKNLLLSFSIYENQHFYLVYSKTICFQLKLGKII